MNALLLTSYYLVYRSLFMYIGISIFVAALVLGFGQESMHPFIVLLTLLLVSIPAMEVIKHESKSGYDKFVLTMPINRAHIVFGHYLFLLSRTGNWNCHNNSNLFSVFFSQLKSLTFNYSCK